MLAAPIGPVPGHHDDRADAPVAAAPQLNLFSFGFPLRVIVALAALVLLCLSSWRHRPSICIHDRISWPEGDESWADDFDQEAKTEEATPRRREQAAEEGQFAVSAELTSGIMVFVGVGTLALLATPSAMA